MNPHDESLHISGSIIFLNWSQKEYRLVVDISEFIKQLGCLADDFTSGVIKYSDPPHPDNQPNIQADVEPLFQFKTQKFAHTCQIKTSIW